MIKRNHTQYLLLGIKGMAMGVADVIPGVSGGTVAFITGIYEELLNSIKSVNKTFFTVLFSKGIPSAWKHVNGSFLLTVVLGILFSIFSLAGVITWLITNYPLMVWAFFFGLIVASAWHVARKINIWNLKTIANLIAGTAVAAYITIATPATTPDATWFIFLSGAIAIMAMILPGISGSFILLLLGKYEFILTAVKDIKISTILFFTAGCVVGIVAFSNVVSWLFRKFPDATMALLTGFMIGSLNKLWPWKEVLSYRLNSAGEQVPFIEKSISHFRYVELNNQPSMLAWVVFFAVLGFLIIFIFDLIADRKTAHS